METTLTKTVHVNGQDLMMSSLDGRTWFLRIDSLHEFDARMRQAPYAKSKDVDEFEIEEIDSDLLEIRG